MSLDSVIVEKPPAVREGRKGHACLEREIGGNLEWIRKRLGSGPYPAL